MIQRRLVFFIVAVATLSVSVTYCNSQRELLPFSQAKDLAGLLPFLAQSGVRGCVVSRGRSYVTVERCYLQQKPELQRMSDHLSEEGWRFSLEEASSGKRVAAWCKGKTFIALSPENKDWAVALSTAPANSCK